jgi:glycosyltransferase involved in cell wall biosynthesis
MNSISAPLVSVVVTTKNEERNIERCLQSIIEQTWKNIETIVVDNGSTDETRTIARKYTALVFELGPERSAQRNHGIIDRATGEFALFVDADMILSPQLVETCVHSMANDRIVALHIGEIVLGTSVLSRIRRFERSFYSGTVIDGVRFFKRKDFVAIGGFDTALHAGPEDWDLDLRFKQRGNLALITRGREVQNWNFDDFTSRLGVRRPKDFVGFFHNEADQPLRTYLRKKRYYAASMRPYQAKWFGRQELKKQLGFSYRFFWVFVEDGKYKMLFRHPFLTLGILVLRVLVGTAYLLQRVLLRRP